MNTRFIGKFTDRVIAFLSSKTYFWLLLGMFVVQATWLASSASFPMLYDEYYHPGVIDYYSHQISPIISSQSDSITEAYGDLTRSPSYLFHYLLSFPYRIIGALTDSFYVLITSIRMINVLLVAGGLIVYRKLFLEMGFSKAVINVTLFVVTVLPIFPFLAAHINYDNLLFQLTPLFLLYGWRLIKDRLSILNIIMFSSLGFLSSLVKQAFLPIFFITTVIVIAYAVRNKQKIKLETIKQNFLNTTLLVRGILVLLLLVASVLFIERQVGNIIAYRTLKPKCQVLQSAESCFKQPVQRRNQLAKEEKKSNSIPQLNLLEYTITYWLPAIADSASYAYSNTGSDETINTNVKANERGEPLPVIKWLVKAGIISVTFILIISSVIYRNNHRYRYGLGILLFYLISVWIVTNYAGYLETGKPFAIQARYFLVLLPLACVLSINSLNDLVTSKATKLSFLVIFIILSTQGGGALTYIYRSNEGWYWNRRTIIAANEEIRKAVDIILID